MLPSLEGIARIVELCWRNGELRVVLQLEGLPDRPLEICARDIEISGDCSQLRVHGFAANMAFAQNALNRFAARPFSIPPGVRPAVAVLRDALGL